MEFLGEVIIYIMMISLLIGAGAHIVRPSSQLGLEFKEGILMMGHIFIPIAGIMTLIPVIVPAINTVVAPVYSAMHSDAAIATSTFIPSDLGAYHLAYEVADGHGAWILAFTVSLTAGATIAFCIPVGLSILERRDHKYLALGVMSGFLAIPFASLFMAIILLQSGVPLREGVEATGAGTRPFDLSYGEVLLNLIPLAIMMGLLSLALRFFTQKMIAAFLYFGRFLQIVTTAAVALSVAEYFTGAFSTIFGSWPLAPFIADAEDQFRALEIVGYIAVMLAGAFPLIYMIRKILAKPLQIAGRKIGISEAGIAGFLATMANAVALFQLVRLMPPKDKVLTIAFMVCAAFAVGDYLAFTATFQPNMIVTMVIGKLAGGLLAVGFAIWLALPYARRLELQDREDGLIDENGIGITIPEEAPEPVVVRADGPPAGRGKEFGQVPGIKDA
ncbi:ethanolamine utilization protein EutH [Nesterenkonia natronophila]|uniref:Ethanolamine utilization protein EutH n=1 Tax=Nesterenkonia natronophila TaxID=2174932 RepID=A0A3A4G3P1_9MICC|nr:ethanolamine utilization protein EutH [Nesterenkonia natronophila]RJN32929.1 ethanolamine utilization protein EutH [Nesterenkonia natronophila]